VWMDRNDKLVDRRDCERVYTNLDEVPAELRAQRSVDSTR